jgi:hypothetical protein
LTAPNVSPKVSVRSSFSFGGVGSFELLFRQPDLELLGEEERSEPGDGPDQDDARE